MSIPPNIKVPHNWLAGVHTEYLTRLDDGGGRYLAVLRGHTPSDLDVVFIIKYDHVHDRFYFVNAMTRDKTWELPDIVGQRQQQQHREQLASMMMKNQQSYYYSSPEYVANTPPTFLPSRNHNANNRLVQQQQTSYLETSSQPVGVSKLPNEISSIAFQRNNSSPSPVVVRELQQQQEQNRESANNSPMSAAGFDENDILDVPLLKHEISRLTESMKDRDALITQFQSSFANHQKEIRALTYEVQRLRKIGISPSPAREEGSLSRHHQHNNNNVSENTAATANEGDADVSALKREVASLRHALEKKQERESVRSPTSEIQQNQNTNINQHQQNLIQNALVISGLSTELNEEKRRNADQQELIQTLRKKIDEESQRYFNLEEELTHCKADHHREVDALKKALEKEQERNLMMISSINKNENQNSEQNTINNNNNNNQELENQLLKLRTQLSSIEAALSHAEVSNLVQERSAAVTPSTSNSVFVNFNNNNSNPSSPTVAILRIPDDADTCPANPSSDENSVNLIHLLVDEVTKLRTENRKLKKDFDSLVKNQIQIEVTKNNDGVNDMMMPIEQVMERDYELFSDYELDDRKRIEEEEISEFPTLRILFKVISQLTAADLLAMKNNNDNAKSNNKKNTVEKQQQQQREVSSDDELHEQMSLGFSPTAEARKQKRQQQQQQTGENEEEIKDEGKSSSEKEEQNLIITILAKREQELFSNFESDDRQRIENEEIAEFPLLRILFKVISSQMKFSDPPPKVLSSRKQNPDEVSSDDELHEQMSVGFSPLNKKTVASLSSSSSPKDVENTTRLAIESLFKFHEVLSSVGFGEKQRILEKSEISMMMSTKTKEGSEKLAMFALQTHFGMMEVLAASCHVEKNLELLFAGKKKISIEN